MALLKDNTMLTIGKEIDAFQKDTEQSVNWIIEGSDEHLDLILAVTRTLDNLSKKFELLNENLYQSIRNFSDDEIKFEIMPKLMEVNKTCMTLIGAIRTSMLYRDVRTSLKLFSKNHDFLREMIYDLRHFRLNKDPEFDSSLIELNAI